MKKLLVTLLATSAFAACKQQIPTARQVQQLKGPVKQTVETPYVAVYQNGQWQQGELKPGKVTMTFNYNRQGEDTSYTITDHEGKLIVRYVSEFDETGLCTGGRSYDGEGKTQSITLMQLYAPNKLPLESTSYSSTGQDTFRNVSEFNDKLQLVHLTIYYKDAEVLHDQRMEFGEKGEQVKRTLHGTDGVTHTTVFEYLSYDEKGNWTKRLEKGEDTILQVRKITYF